MSKEDRSNSLGAPVACAAPFSRSCTLGGAPRSCERFRSSPGPQRWQNLQFSTFAQPLGFQCHAHGLHRPAACRAAITDESSCSVPPCDKHCFEEAPPSQTSEVLELTPSSSSESAAEFQDEPEPEKVRSRDDWTATRSGLTLSTRSPPRASHAKTRDGPEPGYGRSRGGWSSMGSEMLSFTRRLAASEPALAAPLLPHGRHAKLLFMPGKLGARRVFP
mmetsp:Transcript_58680/g.162272  ORF Transcript_58680/g.162272 Transcript_58680/m.162272 type:complete len:219 (+) Transcript_58680:494-1150(+)